MFFVKLQFVLLCSACLVADDSESIDPINMKTPPPNASNSITYRAQLEMFKNPPFRNSNDNDAYKNSQDTPSESENPCPFQEDGPYPSMEENETAQRNRRGGSR